MPIGKSAHPRSAVLLPPSAAPHPAGCWGGLGDGQVWGSQVWGQFRFGAVRFGDRLGGQSGLGTVQVLMESQNGLGVEGT